MHQIFGKGTILLKMGLIMAIAAMVIVNPAWRTELQAKDERGGCDPSSQCCADFHNCKDDHGPKNQEKKDETKNETIGDKLENFAKSVLDAWLGPLKERMERDLP